MIQIFTSDNCPYCVSAKAFLKSMDIEYSEINVSENREKLMEAVSISGMMTVPQIFVGEPSKETLIGGYDDMIALHEAGGFLEKLQ